MSHIIKIKAINPDNEQVKKLLDQSDGLMASLYPAESNHMEGVKDLLKPNVYFISAFLGKKIIGCGAVKILEHDCVYGEIKRMFIFPEQRGKGISIDIINHLEGHLLKKNIFTARLEMGAKQPEAMGLYKKMGYKERSPFGNYLPDPLSIFMEKKLAVSKV